MLAGWGFGNIHRRGQELIADCALCGAKRKFYFNTEKEAAICFRGCFAGSAVSLVSLVEGVDEEEAQSRLNIGVDWFMKLKSIMTKKTRESHRRVPFELPNLRAPNAEEVNYLEDTRRIPLRFATSKGVAGTNDFVGMVAAFRDCTRAEAGQLVDAFPGKFDYLKNRLLWPVFDGRTVLGAEARSIDGTEPKVCYPTGINLKQTLYMSNSIESQNWIVIVEGILDENSVENWGYNAGATFSNHVSKQQSVILHRFDRVYCAYDPDRGGREGLISLIDRCYEATVVYDVQLPAGKDPNDCERYEFDLAFSNARPVTEAHPAVRTWRERQQNKSKRQRFKQNRKDFMKKSRF
jgi:hypothetical protein